MTGRPVTPAQQAADVLAAHLYMPCAEHTPTVNVWWAQCEGCDWKGPRRSYRDRDQADHRAHVAAALAAAGVLTDPDTHDRDAVEWSPTLRNDGTYEYTVTGDCHGTWEQALRRKPSMIRKPSAWEKCDAVPADALYAHEAALDGAGTDAHGEGA